MIDQIQKRILEEVADLHTVPEGAYNIRANGASAGRNTTANIDIVSKTDAVSYTHLDVYKRQGKYRYELARKEKEAKKKQKVIEVKEVRLSPNIDTNDLNTKIDVYKRQEEQFAALGSHKILFNTSIGPSHEIEPLKKWLEKGENYFICDTAGALGDPSGELLSSPQVICPNASAGRTRQAFILLSEKVLANLETAVG